MATVTDLASIAAATAPAVGYTYTQYTNSAGKKIAVLNKRVTGQSGTSGAYDHPALGEDATSFTTAKTNCLASLNAIRRHRFAGAPGLPSAATTGTWPDGAATVPVVDVN